MGPARGPVAGSTEAAAFDKGFEQLHPMAVALDPELGNASAHLPEQMAGQMRHPDPGQDQKAGVVGEQRQVALAHLRVPSDKRIAALRFPCRRAEEHTGERAALRIADPDLQVLAHRGAIAQVVIALLSLMISFWLSYSNDIISRDSTLYINIAQKYLDEGFIEAFKLWSWPFYAIFFAMLHQMTGLGLEYSAYLFSAILEAIICVVFVKIYCKIAFTEKHLWVAALFIITFTGFNAYRGDIIRGYGF